MQNFIQIGWDLTVGGPKTCFGVKTENGQAYAWASIFNNTNRCAFEQAESEVPAVAGWVTNNNYTSA